MYFFFVVVLAGSQNICCRSPTKFQYSVTYFRPATANDYCSKTRQMYAPPFGAFHLLLIQLWQFADSVRRCWVASYLVKYKYGRGFQQMSKACPMVPARGAPSKKAWTGFSWIEWGEVVRWHVHSKIIFSTLIAVLFFWLSMLYY